MQPSDLEICENSSGVFAINANSGATFQWQDSITLGWSNLTNTPPFNNVSNDTLEVNNISITYNNTKFRCLVDTNADGNFDLISSVALLTVNPLPNINVNSSTICLGQSITLNVTGNSNSYSWSPGTGLSATTGATVSANPISTSLFTVTGTINSTGCSSSSISTVTVNSLPNITVNSGSTCAGQTILLTASNADTYTWSPNTNLSSTVGSSVTSSPTANIIYTVTGTTTSTGCSSTATSSVIAIPLPNVTVNSPSYCIGGSAILIANNADTYTWSPNNNLSSTVGASVTANPSSTTIYTVTGTSTSTGCTNTAVSVVTVNQLPNVTVNSPSVCGGQAATVIATAAGTNTFTWSPAIGLSATTGSTVTANPTGTTNYTVTCTNTSTGCSKTAVSTVSINPLPNVNVNSGSTCSGQPFLLTATGANTYTWSPNVSLSSTTGTSVTASPTSTIIYTVTGTDTATGCSSTATAVVTTILLPNVTVNSPSYCFGGSALLTASGADNYTWSPNNNLSSTVGANVTANPVSSTIYTVIGTSVSTGCSNFAISTVTVNPLPTLLVNSPSICFGQSTTLTISGANSYSWSPSVGLNSTTGSSVNANPTNSTIYTIIGIITNTGCSSTTTSSITVNPLPILIASASNDTICAGDLISLSANGANTYTWSPASGLNQTTGSSVNATPLQTTTYTVTGTSSANCQSASTVLVFANPVPDTCVILGPSIVCKGQPDVVYSMSISLNPNYAVSWSASYGMIQSGQNTHSIVIDWTNQPSFDTLLLFQTITQTGCTNIMKLPVEISIDSAPNKAIIIRKPNSNILVASDSSSGIRYEWGYTIKASNIDVLIPNAHLRYVLLPHTFDTTLYIYWANTYYDYTTVSCMTKSFLSKETIPSNNLNASEFYIFPNPASTIINIFVPYENLIPPVGTVSIYNAIGLLVSRNEIAITKQIVIEVPEISNGIYYLELNIANKLFRHKIIVNRIN